MASIWILIEVILVPVIISVTCSGAVLLVIKFLFPDNIPEKISRLRWGIAVILVIIIVFISVALKADGQITAMVAVYTAYFVASKLKQKDKS